MQKCKSFIYNYIFFLVAFETVYELADFELDLMKSEEAENDSDDDFDTHRKQSRVKFKEDVIIHKPSTSNDSFNSVSETIDTSTQTIE